MSLIIGIGDELLYVALLVALFVCVFSSSIRLYAFVVFKDTFSLLHKCFHMSQGIRPAPGSTFDGQGHLVESSSPPENDICCICRQSFIFPCQASCSHWFCGQCILRVWEHTAGLEPCKCPICRRPIKLLSLSGLMGDLRGSQVFNDVVNYNCLHRERPLGPLQRVGNVFLSIHRKLEDLIEPQRALSMVYRVRASVSLMLAIFYFLNPLDLIPEGIFGVVGLLDDFLILLFLVYYITGLFRRARGRRSRA